MYKFRNSLIALFGILALIPIATMTMPHVGRGASGTSSSAPTSQTQNVNVVNTPTVNAQQSGAWNVGINGTPTVNLNSGTIVGISGTPVVGLDASNNTVKFDAVNNTVKIDPATPVLVRDVDNPARQPFQASIDTDWPAGFIVKTTTLLTVPVGKRAVIEYATFYIAPSAGSKIQFAELGTTVGGNPASFDFVGTPITSIGVVAQPLRLYADAGTNIVGIVGLDSTSTGGGEIKISISGYLVNVP